MITTENKITMFNDFLVSMGIKDEFEREFSGSHYNFSFQLFVKNNEIQNLIAAAFPWNITERGTRYWRVVEIGWLNFLNGIMSKN